MLWSQTTAPGADGFRELLLELAEERSLEQLLPLVTRRLAEHEDVALARLWLVGPGDQCAGCARAAACADRTRCLHLVASASRSLDGLTHPAGRLDGAFRRIPIGAFKVGAVAATGEAVVVTDPARDPKIRHPEWVLTERIEGFMGLPLACRGELVGVLGVFVRAPVTAAALEVLRIVASHAAIAIASAHAFEQVRDMRQRLLLRENRPPSAAERHPISEEMIGDSDALREVRRQLAAVAGTDTTVLLLGESGTGKELAARAVHRESPRASGPFVEINCAAIPRELAETELFGHVRGAFSGALRDRPGRFEEAFGGTLFLDEVGELPLELQGKLLRVLQEGTFQRVGDGRTRRADVRIVAATNRNLPAEVAGGRFRQDLYYRLAVFPIVLPPLRDRREDIAALGAHLLRRICERLGRPPLTLTAEDVVNLERQRWPGNVRELVNVLERAVISTPAGRPLTLALPPDQPGTRSPRTELSVPALEGPAFGGGEDHATVLPDFEMRRRERDNMRRALERAGGRIYGPDGAAALLGIKPTTLASRLKRLGFSSARGSH